MSTSAPTKGVQAASASMVETLNARSIVTPSRSSRMSERSSWVSTKYGPSVCSGLTTQVEASSEEELDWPEDCAPPVPQPTNTMAAAEEPMRQIGRAHV